MILNGRRPPGSDLRADVVLPRTSFKLLKDFWVLLFSGAAEGDDAGGLSSRQMTES